MDILFKAVFCCIAISIRFLNKFLLFVTLKFFFLNQVFSIHPLVCKQYLDRSFVYITKICELCISFITKLPPKLWLIIGYIFIKHCQRQTVKSKNKVRIKIMKIKTIKLLLICTKLQRIFAFASKVWLN